MYNYSPVTKEVIEELEKIIGKEYLLFGDDSKMEPYSHDEIADLKYAHMPEVIAMPANAQEISAIMKLANSRRIPVTPRGAGSGLSGGAVPIKGGILLSTERMNKILEIDSQNLIAVLEPGVITNDFNNEVQKEGLFFAGYPMSLEMCYIGGNVAENAGGGRAIKYGVTGNYITGLEVVMPTGEICNYGGKRVKDVTGYSMIQLLVGSEGTLGIFTKIYIKLLPLPPAKIDMMVLFRNVREAIDAVPKIINTKHIIPTGIEFMDKLSIDTTCEFLNETKRHEDAGAVLIIELDGNNSDQIREECLEIGDICLENGALDAFIAEGPADQEKMWKLRRHVAEAFKAISPIQSIEDIVVPIKSIPNLISILDELSRKHNVIIPCYGHAGDGNMHATIVKNPDTSMENWEKILPKVLSDLYKAVRELGGTISGEHGIGHKRKEFLSLVLSEAEIDSMKKIKRALDPNNILNPGKIFDMEKHYM